MSLPHSLANPSTVSRAPVNWRRRTIELMVSLLAFAVWGMLAYKGFVRLSLRYNGMPLGGSWVWDAASLLIGVSGAIAGGSALWAMALRAAGRTPKSIVGPPDDSPDDRPRRDRTTPL